MWLKWLPWRMMVRRLAVKHGFQDPLSIVDQLQRFAQPAEVAMPLELVRLSSILQARGLINNQAIQHNLDWVWPYWVERQFSPKDAAFIPRAFSLSHINLTHRNWTAVGLPGCSDYSIVDPAGLVTPLFDAWSLDCWIVADSGGAALVPSRQRGVQQRLLIDDQLAVLTHASSGPFELRVTVEMTGDLAFPVCRIRAEAKSDVKAWAVISLRPYNPEGVSFIHRAQLLASNQGWKVNDKSLVIFHQTPDRVAFSNYREGDVFFGLPQGTEKTESLCDVGMVTAAAAFELAPDQLREIGVDVPLRETMVDRYSSTREISLPGVWRLNPETLCQLKVPDQKFQYLYDVALKTVLLHSPKEVFPGPYTYKHFWFRDAAFILQAMLCAGMADRVEKVIESSFFSRQTLLGYFHSQDGEWDANGQVLWTLLRFCELTGRPPKVQWQTAVKTGAEWIQRKRVSEAKGGRHAGLLPAGFSAEHLGPNDYYYWDDSWGVAGLRAAAELEDLWGQSSQADLHRQESSSFMASIERSLEPVEVRLGRRAIPASPYRRLDSGAIGSLAPSYPLQLWEASDTRVLDTVRFLLDECMVEGGFFHDMSHSGINPYLSLHIAQTLLRAGDGRYYEIIRRVADLASPTGQWPEAIHPNTLGGCMGDGQHVWAAAEWMMMMRNCFVREEKNQLILFSGIPQAWLESGEALSFGPAPTKFGSIQLSLKPEGRKIKMNWAGRWFAKEPAMEIRLCGFVFPVIAGLQEIEIMAPHPGMAAMK